LPVLLCLDAKVVPGAQSLAPAVRHPFHPLPASGFEPVGDHELDLRVCPLHRAVVAAFPGRVDRAHEVEVLRGHGYSRISSALRACSCSKKYSMRMVRPSRKVRICEVRNSPSTPLCCPRMIQHTRTRTRSPRSTSSSMRTSG